MINKPLWTNEHVTSVCGGRAALNTTGSIIIDGVQIDSRDVIAGDLFIALKGEAMDGHDYVMQAFDNGAVAAMVSQVVKKIDEHDPRLIYVDDTFKALQALSAAARKRTDAQVIGVTGSAGKTSVVQALRKALSGDNKAHSSIRSFNNHVGMPLSVARMPKSSAHGIFEMGMSGPGEIKALSDQLSPDVAIITSIGVAHAAAFDSVEDIAREKASILDGMKAGSTVIIACNHEYVDLLAEKALAKGVELVKVSLSAGNGDIYPLRMVEHMDCTCMTASMGNLILTFKINQPGPEWALNALLVLAAAQAVGADVVEASLALASLEVEVGRGRLYELDMGDGLVTLLDDSYNANPLSMKSALKRFSMLPAKRGQRRFAVLGDMQELGDGTEKAHVELVDYLKAADINHIVAVGPMMTFAAETAGIMVTGCEDAQAAAQYLKVNIHPNDQIFVKGSNAIGLGTLVQEVINFCADEKAIILGNYDSGTLAAE